MQVLREWWVVDIIFILYIINHLCVSGFQRIHSLTNHIKTQHELEINFLCDLCGRGFFTMSRLKSHINDHGGPHGGKRRKKPKLPWLPLFMDFVVRKTQKYNYFPIKVSLYFKWYRKGQGRSVTQLYIYIQYQSTTTKYMVAFESAVAWTERFICLHCSGKKRLVLLLCP